MLLETREVRSTLSDALRAVMPAASRDSDRKSLNSVCIGLEKGDSRLVLVATDGHRLHRAYLPAEADDAPVAEHCRVSLPLGEVEMLERSVRPRKGERDMAVRIELHEDRVVFDGEGTPSITIEAREEKFPPYETTLPDLTNRASVPAQFALHPRYLKEAAQAIGKTVGCTEVAIVPGDEHLEPVLMIGYTDWGEVQCLLMPRRPIRSNVSPERAYFSGGK